ncbi:glycosyltransferase family 39 protein [Ekhidna sp.]|uniref:glycosyltransferase family 39 protein n=1 Tax=Ekhidna sp. TaxID=2608089 RepID=UPI003B50EB28
MNDSPRYLNYADNLTSQGIYFDPLNFWYISYVFFVYLSQLIENNHWIIILNQYVLGYLATLAIFLTTKRLTNSLLAATLAATVFIVFPDNLNWHSYVLTESFYCSILSITFYMLVKTYQERGLSSYIMTGLLLVVCFFVKPTSPALFIALSFPFVWKWLNKPPHQILKFASLMVIGTLFLFLANKMISSHQVMLIYENGDIIFAMHEFPSHPHHDWMTVDIPEDLVKSSPDQPLIQQMAGFVISNPVYFAKLFFGKMIMFVTHIRTYWSWSHNVAMIVILWPLYFFGLRAIRKRLVSNYLGTFSIVYFIIHT